MKNVKKLLASLTALSCIGSLLTAFPAKADTYETFVVVAVDNPEHPEKYILTDTYRGNSYSVDSEEITNISGTTYSVGDVLGFLSIRYSLTESDGTKEMYDLQSHYKELQGDFYVDITGEITKDGSITENPEIQEFTVENGKQAKSYYLKDDSDSYVFYLDWNTDAYYQPDMYAYDFLQAGDTVSCYTYYGKPYIIVNPTPEDTLKDYLIAGVGQENYVLLSEYGSTYYVDKESLNSYLFTDFKPEFGDVLRFRNLDLHIDTIPVEACTLYADLTEIPDKPNSSAIAEHAHVYNRPEYYQIFEITDISAHYMHLSNDQEYFFIDWLNKDYDYQVHPYFQQFLFTQEELWNENPQTVTCLMWNDIPIIPLRDEVRDKTEIGYVLGVDDPENPQQYVLTNVNSIGGLSKTFTAEELAPYLNDTTLKLGDTLILRNVEFYFNQAKLDIRPYEDVQEGRPVQIDVTGSLLDHPTKEFTFVSKTSSTVKVTNGLREFSLRLMPDGIQSVPAPDPDALNQGDTVTCIVSDSYIPLMLYNPEQSEITPDGDANQDGRLSIVDVIMVNKAILGKIDLPSERTPYVDFNGNGVPDSEDSLVMLKMIVGLI